MILHSLTFIDRLNETKPSLFGAELVESTLAAVALARHGCQGLNVPRHRHCLYAQPTKN
jgi:hypothetical protein